MELPNETLDAIRGELPRGGQAVIAEEAGFTPEYVSQVLTGAKPITDGNKKIISIANRLIREKRSEDESIKKDIENLNPNETN